MQFDTMKISKSASQFFPLADRPTLAELKTIGAVSFHPHAIMAVYTGEKRCPKKGEWYLSGAIVQAWRAFDDLMSPYHIARLVQVETVIRAVVREKTC
jgi:hypothetical protein